MSGYPMAGAACMSRRALYRADSGTLRTVNSSAYSSAYSSNSASNTNSSAVLNDDQSWDVVELTVVDREPSARHRS